MSFPIITNLILFIALTTLVLWPFSHYETLYNKLTLRKPFFAFLIGVSFALITVIFNFLLPQWCSSVFSNSRVLLILFSGLFGGPIAILTSTSFIVFSRDLFGSITELTFIMKWHTLITGLILTFVAFYKPITIKNLHYYFVLTFGQFTAVIGACYIIYAIPIGSFYEFLAFIAVAYMCIYFVIKKHMETSSKLQAATQYETVDYLTGLPNNQASEEYINQLIEKKIPFELLHIDIDAFKNFNAAYTYRVGDEVLRQVSAILRQVCRENGMYVGCIGGDEFIVCIKNSNPASAVQFSFELNQLIENTTFACQQQDYHVTVSIVSCSYPQNGKTLDELCRISIQGLKQLTTNEANGVSHINQLLCEGKLHFNSKEKADLH